MIKKTFTSLARIFFLSVFFFGISTASVYAATLAVSPATGTYDTGTPFTVSVLVVTPTEQINAVKGELHFDTSKFQIVSLSKAGSLINFWAPGGEPAYSNATGTITFEGVITGSYFKGSHGVIFSVKVQPKSVGTGTFSFTSGSILANDGLGTNVWTGSANGTFTVTQKAPSTVVEMPTPAAPEVVTPEASVLAPIAPETVVIQQPYIPVIFPILFGVYILIIFILMLSLLRFRHRIIELETKVAPKKKTKKVSEDTFSV